MIKTALKLFLRSYTHLYYCACAQFDDTNFLYTQSRARSLLLAKWEQSVTQHVWTVGLFKTAVCVLYSYLLLVLIFLLLFWGIFCYRSKGPGRQNCCAFYGSTQPLVFLSAYVVFLCLFSLCANISVVFKSKLSQLINLKKGKILYVPQLCSIATHMYFSHLVFYLSDWSDCRLQSP